MAHVITAATRQRANAPTKVGLHPRVAERLIKFGIDPDQFSNEVLSTRGTVRVLSPVYGRPRLLPTVSRETRLVLSHQIGAPRRIELALDPADVRVRPLLNEAALAYKTDEFLADTLAPVKLTRERSGEYNIWSRDDFYYAPDDRIGPNGSAKEVSPTLSRDNYSVKAHSFKGWTSNDTEFANPSIRAGFRTVTLVRQKLEFKRERRVADLFLTAGNYASSNKRTLGSTAKWNGGSTADPIADILAMQEALPAPATDIIFSDITWHVAQQNAALKAILASQINNQGILRPQDIGLYFGIPNVWINKALYRDSSGNLKRIWSEADVWMGTTNRGQDELTFARTFRLSQGAGGFVTKTWRDEDRGVDGGAWTRVAFSDDEKIVAADHGTLIIGVKQ